VTRAHDAVVAAVRGELSDLPEGSGVLVACSGGPDSMALAAGLARASRAVNAVAWAGAVVVDHGLQEGSAEIARRAADQCVRLGLRPAEVVSARLVSATGGPEAAARRARYEALETACGEFGAATILLGHTLEDQAETVLIGLTRGSGPRALAGMPRRSGIYRRPLLSLARSTVRGAFPDLEVWQDPHNTDPRFTRSVVRHDVMPHLVAHLGPSVVTALARSATLTRAETDAVDEWAARVRGIHVQRHLGTVTVDAGLADYPQAVVARVMIEAAVAAGCPRERLTAVHVQALTDRILAWRGQGAIDLPGGIVAERSSGTVVLRPT